MTGPAPAAGEPCYLERRLYDRLKRFDQSQRDEADRVFSWGDDSARTQQWVGVIQVPGLQVEILPKVDAPGADESARRWTRGPAQPVVHARRGR